MNRTGTPQLLLRVTTLRVVWIEIETDKPEVLDLSVTTLRVVWIEINSHCMRASWCS